MCSNSGEANEHRGQSSADPIAIAWRPARSATLPPATSAPKGVVRLEVDATEIEALVKRRYLPPDARKDWSAIGKNFFFFFFFFFFFLKKKNRE